MDNAILGLLSGAIYSLLGYGKNAKTEAFDWKKAVTTIVLSIIIAIICGITGMEYSAITQSIVIMGNTYIVQTIIKAVSRWWTSRSKKKKKKR